jgi:hypothetical protein
MPTRSRWGRGGHVEVGAIVALQRTETRAEAEISAVANLPRVVLTQAMTACGGVDLVDSPNDSCALTEYGHSARASHPQAPSTHVRDGPVIEMMIRLHSFPFVLFCGAVEPGVVGVRQSAQKLHRRYVVRVRQEAGVLRPFCAFARYCVPSFI